MCVFLNKESVESSGFKRERDKHAYRHAVPSIYHSPSSFFSACPKVSHKLCENVVCLKEQADQGIILNNVISKS